MAGRGRAAFRPEYVKDRLVSSIAGRIESSSSAARQTACALCRCAADRHQDQVLLAVRNLSTAENWPLTPWRRGTASRARGSDRAANLDLARIGGSGSRGPDRGRSSRRRWGRAARRRCPGPRRKSDASSNAAGRRTCATRSRGSRRGLVFVNASLPRLAVFRARQTRGSPCRDARRCSGSIDRPQWASRERDGSACADVSVRRPELQRLRSGPARGLDVEVFDRRRRGPIRPRSRRAGAGSCRASARASRTPRGSTHPS